MPGTRPGMTKLSDVEPVEPLRRPDEQVGLLGRARALRQDLAGVPEHRITVGALVDREIALEHRALWPEGVDARLDIRPPSVSEPLRGRRIGTRVEPVAAQPHAEATELHVNI